MKIKFGEKIRELRLRDGRRQEDLATALGVSAQAVSRWELAGGYPDVEMIPAIASFFHVTIDELFGCQGGWEARLQPILERADRMSSDDEEPDRRVALLREALFEFPDEWRLKLRLADALTAAGWQKWEPNIGKERVLPEFSEAGELYESILQSQSANPDVCEYVTISLFMLYNASGDFERAEKLALSRPSLTVSREILLADLTGRNPDQARRAEGARGEAILSLLHHLADVAGNAVSGAAAREPVPAGEGLAVLRGLANLYGAILPNGDFGILHSDLCMLRLRCTVAAAKCGDHEAAKAEFERAIGHYRAYTGLRARIRAGEELPDSPYSGGCVRLAKGGRFAVVELTGEIVETALKALPADLAAAIKSDPRYADLWEPSPLPSEQDKECKNG